MCHFLENYDSFTVKFKVKLMICAKWKIVAKHKEFASILLVDSLMSIIGMIARYIRFFSNVYLYTYFIYIYIWKCLCICLLHSYFKSTYKSFQPCMYVCGCGSPPSTNCCANSWKKAVMHLLVIHILAFHILLSVMLVRSGNLPRLCKIQIYIDAMFCQCCFMRVLLLKDLHYSKLFLICSGVAHAVSS